MAEQNWLIRMKRADFNALGEQFSIDPVVARVMVNRDIPQEQFGSFLHPDLNNLYDPFLMEDMNQAVRIIIHDIEEGHRIRIVSDYDVDGVMSNYILYAGFKRIGAEVDYVIPHRVKDGYGINEDIIAKAAEDGIHTIVTCDNGIAANAALSKAKELGMTVVVTDHHQVPFMMDGEEKKYILPPADAILNPKKETCTYPFDDLCGAGVAYKLIQALFQKREVPEEEMQQFLEFVAVATICDIVSLTDENRTFTVKGLEKLNYSENVGMRALLRINELSDVTVNEYHVGFKLGPCINASGRLESAVAALELFTETDTEMAIAKATNLKEMNEERKEMTMAGVERAQEYIENMEPMKVMVIYLADCHESLAGIIAGRIREMYHHPVLVVVDSDVPGVLKGSGRSIEGYHMFEALQQCSDRLLKFGGHAMAAGFSLQADQFDAFVKELNENCALTEAAFIPTVHIDVPMPMSYVTEPLIEQLDALAPFGKGNEKPVFAQKDLNALSAKIMGKDRNVVKLTLEDKDGYISEGIYFRAQEFEENIVSWFGQEEYDKLLHGWLNNVILNIVYYPSVNEFNGNRTIQMQVKRYAMATVREVL
ncbi:MAG: single-stranded-DNA-specific exonuclease RecJ [Lachnospiraceae bacterium]|nr:single-stranded-DNA-specific exonuclease RecJ [Lachnospiraceae bacterium]HCJ08588.1 single-stranded-DNA-specific exonuclease RecJ [Lachnospiraceae bacterium]